MLYIPSLHKYLHCAHIHEHTHALLTQCDIRTSLVLGSCPGLKPFAALPPLCIAHSLLTLLLPITPLPAQELYGLCMTSVPVCTVHVQLLHCAQKLMSIQINNQ